MLSDILYMGPFTWPLMLIAVANLAQIAWRAKQVASEDVEDGGKLRSGIDAIIFWGAVALLLGFIGQYTGLYRSMNAMASLDTVSHRLVSRAIAETVMPTIVGMVVLLYSALGWYFLRARLHNAAPTKTA